MDIRREKVQGFVCDDSGVSCFVQDGGVGCLDLWDRTSTLAHMNLYSILVHEETKKAWLSIFIRSTFVLFSLCSLSEEESTPEPY